MVPDLHSFPHACAAVSSARGPAQPASGLLSEEVLVAILVLANDQQEYYKRKVKHLMRR